MTKLLKAASLVIVFFLTSCSISEFGAPPLNQEDRWSRAGYTKSQIRSALSMCGQDEPWSIKNMEKVWGKDADELTLAPFTQNSGHPPKFL